MPRWAKPLPFILFISVALATSWFMPAQAGPMAQIPTISIPTVTGTPTGPIATVKEDQDQVNVRTGPSVFYPKVGYLLPGQSVVIKGKTEAGLWLLIDYPGTEGGQAWVYSPLMDVPTGSHIPIVEPPPTPTAQYTNTIDPTLAAQFIVTVAPTRLPTFTPPAPLVIPTQPADKPRSGGGIPVGMVIVTLASLGVFLGFLSILRGR